MFCSALQFFANIHVCVHTRHMWKLRRLTIVQLGLDACNILLFLNAVTIKGIQLSDGNIILIRQSG